MEKKNDILWFKPDMDNAFMVAGLQVDDPSNNGINLDFYPAFTAFEFTVGSNADITVESFQMKTDAYQTETSNVVPLFGTAVATFDSSDSMSYEFTTASSPAPGQTITVTFNGSGAAYNPIISTTTSMNFLVFALPQNLTGIQICFNLSNGRKHTLKLKQNDEWITFPAGAKCKISGLLVPGATWYINFDYPREEQWVIHPDIEIGVE